MLVCGLMLFVLKSKREESNLTPRRELTRIEVLPFSNASPDKIEAYLNNSLTTELVNSLRQATGLNALLPVPSLAAQPVDQIRAVLAPLDVPFLVEGSVRSSEGKIIVSGRLMETSSGVGLLSTNYQREPRNLLGVPNDLAVQIAERALPHLSVAERNRIRKTPTQNPEAYDYYFRGRFDLQGNSLRGSETNAVPALEQAVGFDQNFALAYADLSRAYVTTCFYFHPEQWPDFGPKASQAFERALALDPNLPEAHFAKAYFCWTPFQHWKVETAITGYRRALQLRPSSTEMCDQLGLIYLHSGLFDEARKLTEHVKKFDPLNPLTHYLDANRQLWQGNDQGAVNTWRALPSALKLNFVMNSYLAVALINLDQTNDAATLIEEAVQGGGVDSGGLLTSVHAIMMAKQHNESGAALDIEAALKQRGSFGHFHHTLYNIVTALALLNQQERALKYLREAAADGFPCYPFFEVDKNLQNLRTNREFAAFMKDQKKVYDRDPRPNIVKSAPTNY
jgi:TolB-like protein